MCTASGLGLGSSNSGFASTPAGLPLFPPNTEQSWLWLVCSLLRKNTSPPAAGSVKLCGLGCWPATERQGEQWVHIFLSHTVFGLHRCLQPLVQISCHGWLLGWWSALELDQQCLCPYFPSQHAQWPCRSARSWRSRCAKFSPSSIWPGLPWCPILFFFQYTLLGIGKCFSFQNQPETD